MEWIALLLILWIISSFLYHKSLAKDSKRFCASGIGGVCIILRCIINEEMLLSPDIDQEKPV